MSVSTATEENNQTIDQEAYEAEMVAKADGAEEASLAKDSPETFDNKETEETLLAGKYKTPEDLEKAYKELESKLGEQKPEQQEEEGEEVTKEAKEIVEAKGLDFDGLTQEFVDNGELSEDTYKKLEEAGITKEVVDNYIAGQEAIKQSTVSKLQSYAGGEEGYNEMLEWARSSLSDAEKEGFNKAINSLDTAEFAIKGLYARYKAEAEPKFVQGTPATGGNVYSSRREMMADMASAKYKTDPAFREAVAKKVARSKL